MQLKSSSFFEFKSDITDNYRLGNYLGWNSLVIAKFKLKKGIFLSSLKIDDKFDGLKGKQKIIVVIKGFLEIEIENKKKSLKHFDAVDIISSDQKFNVFAKEETIFFMISAKNLEQQSGSCNFFNFKRDIEIKDLWGGQCISRPYEGGGLTLVLFDLKKGFKFEDKGHKNEQITWLIDGRMDFYADGKHKTLNLDNGVDIGPNHLHGGISSGALGFDAFFPKRQEVKYKN